MSENGEKGVHTGTEKLKRRGYTLFMVFSILSYLLIVYAFYIYLTQRGVTLTLVLPIMVAITIVVSVLLLRNLLVTGAEISLKAKRYEEILSGITHTYNVLSATKDIRILDKEGDAVVKTSFVCRNADKELNNVNISISHDGTLGVEDVECSFNNVTVTPSNAEMQKIVNAETDEPIAIMPCRLIFKIKPDKPVLGRQLFSYGYKYKCDKLYPEVTKKGKEATIIEILHPNSKLTIAVNAPEGYEFDEERNFLVYDRDGIEHTAEMKRIEVSNLPYFINQKKTMIWEIIEPKIADRYKLYFSISQKD